MTAHKHELSDDSKRTHFSFSRRSNKMRDAKLAAVLLLALSGGASAAVNETDCAIVADVAKCTTAPSEEYCDTSIMCTFYEGSCQMNFTLAEKAIPWYQSSSSSDRVTAGTDLCRADSDCTIKNGNIFNRINADGTITPSDVNICDDYDGDDVRGALATMHVVRLPFEGGSKRLTWHTGDFLGNFSCPIVWKSTGTATPSSRRRVDGVEVDAKNQRGRAVI